MNKLRIKHIINTSGNSKGKYILYWMQQSQRMLYNGALNYALELAHQNKLPVVVYFGLVPTYPDANLRHYYFMLEGISELSKAFHSQKISFQIRFGSPDQMISSFYDDAMAIIMDIGYTKIQRLWRKNIYLDLLHKNIDVYTIETDTFVPITITSSKKEYGAYTIRPKIKKLLPDFCDISEFYDNPFQYEYFPYKTIQLSDLLSKIQVSNLIGPSPIFHGGYSYAKQRLFDFINTLLEDYPNSNDPSKDSTSKLSMYLHFGQISVHEVYQQVMLSNASNEAKESFLEQLIIRRELAFNFCFYQKDYDDLSSFIEPWAKITLVQHQLDKKPYIYQMSDYLSFQTHDPYFNAAMKEMVYTGFMHNYMRMYWAKKILEWSPTYLDAYQIILSLNNSYFIDGRDPLSYTGVAWCFGTHDRPFQERSIFGKVRYMNESGLKRKFNIESYVIKMNQIEQIIVHSTELDV